MGATRTGGGAVARMPRPSYGGRCLTDIFPRTDAPQPAGRRNLEVPLLGSHLGRLWRAGDESPEFRKIWAQSYWQRCVAGVYWWCFVVGSGRECHSRSSWRAPRPSSALFPLCGEAPVMFLGEYTHSLDAKGRLTVPARFRPQLEEGLVMARGEAEAPCLVIHPQHEWEQLAAALARLPRSRESVRSYYHVFFSRAIEATMDKMGRVLVPAFLREYAGIGEEAVLVGANTVIEIWNPEVWRDVLRRDEEKLESILASVADMGI